MQHQTCLQCTSSFLNPHALLNLPTWFIGTFFLQKRVVLFGTPAKKRLKKRLNRRTWLPRWALSSAGGLWSFGGLRGVRSHGSLPGAMRQAVAESDDSPGGLESFKTQVIIEVLYHFSLILPPEPLFFLVLTTFLTMEPYHTGCLGASGAPRCPVAPLAQRQAGPPGAPPRGALRRAGSAVAGTGGGGAQRGGSLDEGLGSFVFFFGWKKGFVWLVEWVV